LREARLFLFDEPNSALSEEESEHLFTQLRRLTSNPNHFVIMVSHRLGDLTALSKQVAVIREGVCTEILSGAGVTEHALARALVVGIPRADVERARRAATESAGTDQPVITLADWSGRGGAFTAVDMTIPVGQVVAIMGVEGSGGRELVRSLAGFEQGRGTY